MRVVLFAAMLGLISLTACAHGRGGTRAESSDEDAAEARVNRWVGRHIEDVILAWGPPTISLRQGSGKVYKWRWGKPERFSNRSKDSRSGWVDLMSRWTPAGSIVAKSTGWMGECRETFDVDARGWITAAQDGR